MHQMAKILLLLNLRSAPTNIAYFHPRIIPASIIGIRLKFIAKNCVFIVNSLSNIINIANNNDANIIFLLFEIVYFLIYYSPLLTTLFYQNFVSYSICKFIKNYHSNQIFFIIIKDENVENLQWNWVNYIFYLSNNKNISAYYALGDFYGYCFYKYFLYC